MGKRYSQETIEMLWTYYDDMGNGKEEIVLNSQKNEIGYLPASKVS